MPATRFLVLSLLARVILYLAALSVLAVERRKLLYLPQGEALPPAEAGLDCAKVLHLTTATARRRGTGVAFRHAESLFSCIFTARAAVSRPRLPCLLP